MILCRRDRTARAPGVHKVQRATGVSPSTDRILVAVLVILLRLTRQDAKEVEVEHLHYDPVHRFAAPMLSDLDSGFLGWLNIDGGFIATFCCALGGMYVCTSLSADFVKNVDLRQLGAA
jgi:hypothetical protein